MLGYHERGLEKTSVQPVGRASKRQVSPELSLACLCCRILNHQSCALGSEGQVGGWTSWGGEGGGGRGINT